MLRDGLYAAYTWRVRQFKEGETNETTISFTPDGRPYGFVERLKEDAPGPALDAGAARRIAEDGARLALERATSAAFMPSSKDRSAGPADASITRSPTSAGPPTLNEGRYRLRLWCRATA